MDTTASTGGSTDATQPFFSIEKIYIKDASLEVPHAPEIFTEQVAPEISIELNTQAKQVGENFFEAELKVTVSAVAANKTYFLVEVCQAGVFQVTNLDKEQLDPLLGIACPNLLFPYAREAVSDIVTRAGFPPVILQPVNFEGLYVSRLQDQAQSTPPADSTVKSN